VPDALKHEKTDRASTYYEKIVTYRRAPHVDVCETGVRAARLLLEIVERKAKPTVAFVKLPLLICGDQAQTLDEPIASLSIRVPSMRQQPGLVSEH